MSLAVKQHCSRDVIRTNLSFFLSFFFFYLGDIAKTCGTFMIRRGKKAFEHCCPVSHAHCEWLSVKLMVWGEIAGWPWQNRMQMWLQGIQVRKQLFPKHSADTHAHVWFRILPLLSLLSFLPLDPPHFSLNISFFSFFFF